MDLPLSHPTFLVWASNTSLGKTLVSAGLAASSLLSKSLSKPRKFLYLKPIQTGFPPDSDSSFVFRKLSHLSLRRHRLSPLFASNHVLKASVPAAKAALGQEIAENCESGIHNLGWYQERRIEGDGVSAVASELVCKTLYAWREAVSPHLAAQREGAVVEDAAVLRMLLKCLREEFENGRDEGNDKDVFCVVETAGGVASPGPSGLLQCDLYRPLRLPAILVGDGRLGGISGTISAYESLKIRGYDVIAIVFADHGLVNEKPLLSYLRNRVPVHVLPPVPEDLSNDLMEWFDESYDVFDSLKEKMLLAYSERIKRLHEMPKKAGDIFWWPFTQHQLVPEGAVTVIDSRYGENFAVFKGQSDGFIAQQFDACASWWTQGPDATFQGASD